MPIICDNTQKNQDTLMLGILGLKTKLPFLGFTAYVYILSEC